MILLLPKNSLKVIQLIINYFLQGLYYISTYASLKVIIQLITNFFLQGLYYQYICLQWLNTLTYLDIQKKCEHVHNFRQMCKHERNLGNQKGG